MDNPQTENDSGEFAALGSFDLIAAFLHQKYGEKALRESFARVECHREQLEEAATVLKGKGLDQVAEIVFDIAAQRPSEFDVSNPYESGSTNWRYWRENWVRKHHQQSPEFKRQLWRRHSRKQRQT
jgi:hypothetical protein